MKYSKELVETLCKHLKKGSSIKSACAAVGISKETFYEWKKKKPDFSDSIEQAMAVPDKKVENALYKNARGFFYTETEYKSMASKDGLKVIHIPVKKVRKMIVPNVAAQKFILINRNPEEWKDKKEQDVTVKGSLSIPEMKKSVKEYKEDGS